MAVKNILFVCTANKLRSPTGEQVFANWPNVETDSAGLARDADVVLSGEQIDWCQLAAETFGKKYDVKVSMTRNGSGSNYAKILAEKQNPKCDVWYGGTLDPHSQAGVNGLLQAYKSPMLKEIGEPYKIQPPVSAIILPASMLVFSALAHGTV